MPPWTDHAEEDNYNPKYTNHLHASCKNAAVFAKIGSIGTLSEKKKVFRQYALTFKNGSSSDFILLPAWVIYSKCKNQSHR